MVIPPGSSCKRENVLARGAFCVLGKGRANFFVMSCHVPCNGDPTVLLAPPADKAVIGAFAC